MLALSSKIMFKTHQMFWSVIKNKTKQKTQLFFILNGRNHRLVLRTHLSLLLSFTKNWDCGFSWARHSWICRVLENFLAWGSFLHLGIYHWFKVHHDRIMVPVLFTLSSTKETVLWLLPFWAPGWEAAKAPREMWTDPKAGTGAVALLFQRW